MADQAINWSDPYRNYNFKLVIGSETAAHFTQVSGLQAVVDAIRYREGGANQITHRLPGQVTYGDITLHYGVTDDAKNLFAWFMSAVEGNVERRNVSLVMLDSSGSAELVRWNLIDAWPSAWNGSPFDAQSSGVAIESITLVYETLQREQQAPSNEGASDEIG